MTKKKRVSRKKKAKAEVVVDPTYQFIKGKGWLPSLQAYATAWEIIGQYRVIVEQRTPEEGENYFSEDRYEHPEYPTTLSRVIRDLKDQYWEDIFTHQPIEDIKRAHIPVWGPSCERYERGRDVFVIRVEPKDGPEQIRQT